MICKYTIYLLNFNIKYQQSYFPKHQIRKTKNKVKQFTIIYFGKISYILSFKLKFFLFLPIIISYYCKLHHKNIQYNSKL